MPAQGYDVRPLRGGRTAAVDEVAGFSPKGRDNIAQGNALGPGGQPINRPERAQHNSARRQKAMRTPRGRLTALALAAAGWLLAAGPARPADPPKPDPQALAARIDAAIDARLAAAGV